MPNTDIGNQAQVGLIQDPFKIFVYMLVAIKHCHIAGFRGWYLSSSYYMRCFQRLCKKVSIGSLALKYLKKSTSVYTTEGHKISESWTHYIRPKSKTTIYLVRVDTAIVCFTYIAKLSWNVTINEGLKDCSIMYMFLNWHSSKFQQMKNSHYLLYNDNWHKDTNSWVKQLFRRIHFFSKHVAWKSPVNFLELQNVFVIVASIPCTRITNLCMIFNFLIFISSRKICLINSTWNRQVSIVSGLRLISL